MPKPRVFHVGIKGLIVKDQQVLLLRHRSFWDLPGGRIDATETADDALNRELSEELPGVSQVSVGPLLGCGRVADISADLGLFIVVYRVAAQTPEPVVVSEEHDFAEWVTIERARSIITYMPIDWSRLQA